MAPTRPHRDQGLTLIEMVVAIGITIVVLVSALSVFVMAKKAQQTAEGTDRATQLANSRIERIRQQDWRDIGFRDVETFAPTVTTGPTTATTINADEYAAYTGTEATVKFAPATSPWGAADVKPYETTTYHDTKFTIYTAITYGAAPTLGLPTTNAQALTYSFKRVKVTVKWQSSGNGAHHQITTESWFAPEAQDAAPPSVTTIVTE